MKKYLKIFITLILLMLIPLILTVNAAIEDITISLSSETRKIKEGDEVIVILTVNDANKILGLEAELKESEFFEVKSVTIAQGEGSYRNGGDNRRLEIYGDGISENIRVIITLKILKTPTETARFEIENIKIAEDAINLMEPSISVNSQSVQFEGISEEPDDGNGDNNGNQNGNGEENNNDDGNNNAEGTNNPNDTNNSNGSEGTKTTEGQSKQKSEDSEKSGSDTERESTMATGKLPQTGENRGIMLGLIVMLTISVITYIQYKKYKTI